MERTATLDHVCAGDRPLDREVESSSFQEDASTLAETLPLEHADRLLTDSQAGLTEGRTLGHYKIIRRLDSGGCGKVYLARDDRLNRLVAIKILFGLVSSDFKMRQRFEQEARTLANLTHPHICTLFDMGNQEGVDYLVMEYVEGKTLAGRLASGPLPVEEAMKYAVQIADALAYSHRHGIIHRDIKPKNVVLTEGDQVKLVDFGLAKPIGKQACTLDHQAATAIEMDTDPGTILGTVIYMSPEQIRCESIDARSDIFSLGVTIYEMITGRLPFEGNNQADVLAGILRSEPSPLTDFAPEIPAELQRIVSRALSKDREQRYQTAEEMLGDLNAFQQEIKLAAKPGRKRAGTTEVSSLLPARLFSPRLAPILLLPLAIIGGILWALVGLRNQPDMNSLSSLKSVPHYSWMSERGEGTLRARFSHDGKMIAYSSMSDGWMGIRVKQAIIGTHPYLITKDKADNWWPIWSPDDQQIAYISKRGDETGIWSIPALSGTPKPLITLSESFPVLILWSKDGSIIYYQAQSNLYAANLVSKQVSRITNFDPSKLPSKHFSISPDEKHLTYTDAKDGQVDVWVAPMRGGEPVRATNDPEEDSYPVWHPDGKRVVYTSNRAGVYEICVAYLDGRKPLQLTVGGSSDRSVSDISSDGTRILQVSTRDDAEVYGVEISSGREHDLLYEIGLKLWPEASPDGRMIAFQYTSTIGRLVSSSIIARPLAAGGQPLQIGSDGFNLSWSPDGSKVAFLRFSEGEINIFTVSGSGGDEKQITTGGVSAIDFGLLPSNLTFRSYSWSPDGKKIVYCSKKSGASNIWTIDADGSDDVKITSNDNTSMGFYGPVWSPDGKRVGFVSKTTIPLDDAKTVWSLWLAEQWGSRLIFTANSFMRLVGWADSGDDLIVAIDEENSGDLASPINVVLLGITVGKDKREIVSLKSVYIGTIRISPDRQTLAFISDRDGTNNIWTVAATGGKSDKVTVNTDPKLYLANPAWSPDGRMVYYSKQTRWNLISIVENFR
ncbi:MAG TPA: protein kinase [Blastocatellia bacterium]|nr:protein kinase [Blastocatellia bacterium]